MSWATVPELEPSFDISAQLQALTLTTLDKAEWEPSQAGLWQH